MKRAFAALVTALVVVATVVVFVQAQAGAVTGVSGETRVATVPLGMVSGSATSSEAATAQADVDTLGASYNPNPPSAGSVGPCSVTLGDGVQVSGTCTCTDLGLGTFCFVANCQVSGMHLVQPTHCYILNFGNTGYWTGVIYFLSGFFWGYVPL